MEKRKIGEDILKYRNALHTLYLSIEPHEFTLDVEYLTSAIDTSQCGTVVILQSLNKENKSCSWEAWAESWGGELTYSNFHPIAKNLARGLESILNNKRPWITTVSAASLTGHHVRHAHLVNEFGYISYINDTVGESRALFCSEDEIEILASIVDENSVGEPLDPFLLDGLDNLNGLIQHCINENISNIVYVCNMATLAELIERRMVDEIIHYVTPKGGTQE